jgi:mono/diheme cytochrome c family protein
LSARRAPDNREHIPLFAAALLASAQRRRTLALPLLWSAITSRAPVCSELCGAYPHRGNMSKLRGLVSVCTLTLLLGCEQLPAESADDDIVEPGDDDQDDDIPDARVDASRRDARVPDGGIPPFRPDSSMRPPLPPPPRLSSLIVADRPPPPISGGTLSVTEDGALAVAADSDRDAVYVVNVASRSAVTITLPQGSEPGRTALDGSGQVHVVLRGSGKVARVELGGQTVAQSTSVCQYPRGIAYDRAQDAVHIACADGELVTLAAKTHAELARVMVDRDLRDVIITNEGTRYVSRYRSAELLEVAADGKVSARSPAATSQGANFGVPTTMEPTLAWRTVLTPQGQPFMLHQKSQKEEVQATPGGYGGACGSITQPGITEYDQTGRPLRTGMFPGVSLTVDVAVSPTGNVAALATPAAYLKGQGTLNLVSLSAFSSVVANTPKLLPAAPRPDIGDGGFPTPAVDAGFPSIPCFPQPAFAPDAQVTSVAFDGAGGLYAFSREPAQLLVFAVPGDGFSTPLLRDTISLSSASVRDTGHELFHADVGGGLACASCHGEALDDGHVWTFAGFGPRRTQNMRGGFLQTLPLHWEGDMPTFQHLVDEVMTGRMSGFKVEPRFADALASWIDKQPALALVSNDAARVAQGKALFESQEVGCATCHSGPALTNNSAADVGTGERLQVPSLLGLALRAPFMHDGCAATLQQRFEPSCGGGDKHGKTSQLTPEQTAQLIAYLESL